MDRGRWGVVAAVVVVVLGTAGFPAAGQTVTEEFQFTGDDEEFEVPADVCEITVDAYGAEGGTDEEVGSTPGRGGRVTGDIEVAPGEILVVRVGGEGSAPGEGDNGGGPGGPGGGDGVPGGGGGGASSVRDLDGEILVIAGGGGGGGNGGVGGHGGQTGENGGQGGFAQGGLAGGNGGSGGAGNPPGAPRDGGDGTSATVLEPGMGGTGGTAQAQDGSGGGGGGGGLVGGGGGGAGDDEPADPSGGGGGGSSSGPAGSTFQTGARSGNGLIILEFTPDPGCDRTRPAEAVKAVPTLTG